MDGTPNMKLLQRGTPNEHAQSLQLNADTITDGKLTRVRFSDAQSGTSNPKTRTLIRVFLCPRSNALPWIVAGIGQRAGLESRCCASDIGVRAPCYPPVLGLRLPLFKNVEASSFGEVAEWSKAPPC